MKIEIPASKSKETVPSPFIPNTDYPVRVPVQEQRYVANRKNPTIFFCSGFLIGLFVATFILMKKHGFDIFKSISTKCGNGQQQKPQLAKLDPLELYDIVVNIPKRNVHDEEPPDCS